MTDHPAALVSVPTHVLEAIAFNLCSLHDFDPAFVQQNERFAKAAITEYLRATPAPAAPQAAGVGEDAAWTWIAGRYPNDAPSDLAYDANEMVDAFIAGASLRAPSREPEGGARRFRHWARGTTYVEIGEARLQQSGQLGPCEGDAITVYRGDDGQLWARASSEFHDGRFEELPALTPRHEAPADDGPVFHMNLLSHEDNEAWLESARRVAAKHEAPAEGAGEREEIARTLWISRGGIDRLFDEGAEWKNGNGFEQRQQCFVDADAILALRARSSAPEAREDALGNLLAVIHGDGGHRALEVGVEQAAAEAEKIVARLLSSAPEAREGEAWPERWSGPCTVGNMISNLRTLPPEMPLYSAYHIPMDDRPSLLKVKRPTLSRERVDGTNIKTGDESIPYSAVIWSQPRDPEEAHPAAPSADKLRDHLEWIETVLTDPVPRYTARIATAREYIGQALAALQAEHGAK